MEGTRLWSILAIALLLTACAAQAGPIELGVWYQIVWSQYMAMDPGYPCGGCLLASGSQEPDLPPWTFVLPSNGGVITVQDVFLPGEAYHIFDFGVLVGTTSSAPLDIEYDCGYDVYHCLGHPKWSWGRFPLGPGAHSIVITLAPTSWSPLFPYMGYFRVDHAPEPATLLLSGAGLAAFALVHRRRKRRTP
ncbi:MAG TPA: PEP-CTERM sorting domain-containing protein [Bryobacteraceae bacterium]|nr:PEP-CTERM sorting domain-containing protein [Bryobacteraceae bacterium]